MGNFFYTDIKSYESAPSETVSNAILGVLMAFILLFIWPAKLITIKAGIIFLILIIIYITLFYLLRDKFNLYNNKNESANIIYFSFSIVFVISFYIKYKIEENKI